MIFKSRTKFLNMAVTSSALFASAILLILSSSPTRADDRPVQIRYELPGTVPILQPDPLRLERRQIVIADHSITPKEIVLDHGEPFGWISRSRTGSRIVFEREVAHAIVCYSLINFSIQDDELKSSELRFNDVANFCDLEPGRYHYRVVHDDLSSGARRRMEGVIVVRPTAATVPARKVANSVAP